jgi:hypothetical protein
MSDEPKKRSWAWLKTDVAPTAHRIARLSFGTAGFAFSGALLSFIIGLGLTDAALDAFWPQCDIVAWLRLAGGLFALCLFLSAILWRSSWSWRQVLVTVPLAFVSIFLLGLATRVILDPRLDPILILCRGFVFAIALSGALGILGRRFWPGRKHHE